MSPTHFTVIEGGLIRSSATTNDQIGAGHALLIDDRFWGSLRGLANLPEVENILRYSYQRGQETIRVGTYAGIIELPGGAVLEILPKIWQQNPVDSVSHHTARIALLRMLRHLHNTPFRILTDAHLGAARLPLWNVFVLTFLDALTLVTRQGLQTAYQTIESNQPFVRGRLQPARHLRENLVHAERLAVAFDALTVNVPPNRILKSALLHVLPRAGSVQLETRLYQLLTTLNDVPPSTNLGADLSAIRRLNRLFDRYSPALRWAELLLTGRAFGPRTGATSALSLLFPMERVFEDYVAHGFRAFWPEGEVTTQESSAHLVDEHGGLPKFRLRPDVLVRQANRTLVFDTKWKTIDGTNTQRQYGIESSDLYQLFAYGKKYEACDVYLIYPASQTFHKPLDVFGYDPAMRLHVLPFNINQPLREEVEKVWKYVSVNSEQ